MTALAFLFAVFLARPVPLLHPRRGRGGARRPQPRPLPDAAAPLRRSRAVHRDHPPEAHDGGRRLAVRRLDGPGRRLQGALAPPAGSSRHGAGCTRGRGGRRGRLSDALLSSRAPWPATGANCSSPAMRDPAPARGGDGGEPAPRQRGGLFRRLRESMSKTRQALGSEIQATLFGDARRAHLGTPGGGADHGRRRRQHDRRGRAELETEAPRASSRAARR